jgi:L-2-hydroxyglutarate oxidase LhgO
MPKCFVVGAGVVGIAVARALAQRLRIHRPASVSGAELDLVTLVETASSFGTETSSRNSEVIHSGIYYNPGSKKALHCVRGAAMLYRYAQARGVEHRRCGKIIVATSPSQESKLESIMKNGIANGVQGLKYLSSGEIRALEPAVHGVRAILVPSTGIIDSHGLMTALLVDAEELGAIYVRKCRFLGAKIGSAPHRYAVHTSQGVFDADILVNCAGHLAPAAAARIEALPPDYVPRPYFSKGTYFKLRGAFDCFTLVLFIPKLACSYYINA